eukprot:scaffold237944_cov27-Prasinocladus_malaysianus.AAC.1
MNAAGYMAQQYDEQAPLAAPRRQPTLEDDKPIYRRRRRLDRRPSARMSTLNPRQGRLDICSVV